MSADQRVLEVGQALGAERAAAVGLEPPLGLGAAFGLGLLEARDDGGARRRRAARRPAPASANTSARSASPSISASGTVSMPLHMARKLGGGN